MERTTSTPLPRSQDGAALASLIAAVSAPGDPPPAVRETHMSWVVLAADRAFKLKKPVRFGFVDFSTPDLRRRACEEEVRVNQALASSVVLAVRALDLREGRLVLGEHGTGSTVDWVVEMRRFDEDRTMVALLERGELTPAQVSAVGGLLARFHAAAAPCRPEDAPAFAGLVERNLAELRPLCDDIGAGREAAVAGRTAVLVARARAGTLAARRAAGLVVDGHGDLRAEHVVLEDDGVVVVDRLEFDASLRAVDTGDDLAFLVMDLVSRDGRWAAQELLKAYRKAGGDPGDDALVALFAAYRAHVRAKVDLLRAGQLDSTEARQERRGRARRLLEEAVRFAWRSRGAVLLAVTGPPACGKSTLAGELSRASGLPVLSSDLVRREAAGGGRGPAPAVAYTPQARADVYAELGRRAGAAMASGGAIVDATFGEPALRDAFLGALGRGTARALVVVELRAPVDVLVERARRRGQEGPSASDAGPDVAVRLARGFSPVDVEPGRRLVLDATAPAGDLAGRVGDWLDARVAADR